MYLFDLLLVLGLYSCDSSSMPFCLLYQSNNVRRMEGRQYSERELIELMTCTEKRAIKRLGHAAGYREMFYSANNSELYSQRNFLIYHSPSFNIFISTFPQAQLS